MKRLWYCVPTQDKYIIFLVCNGVTHSVHISKVDLYHTLDPKTYIEYYLIRLNEQAKETILPLARDLQRAKHIRREYK